MELNIRLLLIVLAFFFVASCDFDSDARLMEKRWVNQDWTKNKPEIWLDVDGDGEKERALIGHGQRSLVIVVMRQEVLHLMDFVEIFLNKPSQYNAICTHKAALSVVTNKAPNLGFKSCPSCELLLLQDSQAMECKPFYIYWDAQQQRLTWYRESW